MERRRFLQQSGLAVAGGAGVLVPTRVLADAAAERAATNGDAQPQRVLVTAAETPLAQALAESLPAAWQVHLTAAMEVTDSRPVTKCALEADESTPTSSGEWKRSCTSPWPRPIGIQVNRSTALSAPTTC